MNNIEGVPEEVVCAAVAASNGLVIHCHRHRDGFAAIHMMGLTPRTASPAQGFVTSRRRFVSRAEAWELQVAAGIESIAPGGYRGTELYSEDLY